MPVFTLLQHKEEEELSQSAKLMAKEMQERIFKRRFTIFIPSEDLPDDYRVNSEFWKKFIINFLKRKNFKNIDGRYSVFEKTPEEPNFGEEIFFGEVKEGWWIF